MNEALPMRAIAPARPMTAGAKSSAVDAIWSTVDFDEAVTAVAGVGAGAGGAGGSTTAGAARWWIAGRTAG